MENTQSPISSIICFNGGSGGDMLLTLCLNQLNHDFQFYFRSNGYINLKQQYFKDITQEIFLKKTNCDNIDYSKVNQIENTHYWLDFYNQIAQKIYFIDYPDVMQEQIMTRYIQKRYHNNWNSFVNLHKQLLPEFAQKKITSDNAITMFLIQWKKNLVAWRNNTQMIPINFLDFSNADRMQDIIESIINQSLVSKEIFKQVYNPWIEKNIDFFL